MIEILFLYYVSKKKDKFFSQNNSYIFVKYSVDTL